MPLSVQHPVAAGDDLRDLAGGASPSAASLVDVRKEFGGVVALAHASFGLRAGEVLALLGENGAGKSTCVKMLAGVHRPDSGSIRLDGHDVVLRSPHDALARGIAVMHQHPGLFPDLSVAENIAIGHMPLTGLRQLDQKRIEANATRLLQVVGLDCAPGRPLALLRSSEQQLVEVARALSVEARVLIMDEPTASLSRGEVERLFAVVEQLKRRGVAMMFVGHRMEEIYRIADRVVVLRDGRQVGMAPIGEMPPAEAVTLMVGRKLGTQYPALDEYRDKVVLQAGGLSRQGAFADVSFDLHAGQILGFGGMVGSGRTEVARVLFGIDQPTAGTLLIDGVPRTFASAGAAMRAAVAYVSEDRLGQSLVMDFSILDNASLTVLRLASRWGLISRERELSLVETPLGRMNLRYHSYDQPVSTLSGGNQQKVVLAKWLATAPRILILDEPTQGIDVNAKAEVHAIIADLARAGMAIILISSEMPELLGMCHDILVFREGHVSARMKGKEATQQSVLLAATDAAAAATATEALQAAREDPAVRPPARRRSLLRRELGLVAAIVAMIVPATLINPRMLSAANIDAVAMDLALLIIVAAGEMLVMITRNIDLSVASVIGLSAYVCADMLHLFPGLPLAGAVAIAGLVGLGCGLVNGLVVTRGRVPSIVVTLGTLSLYRGLLSMTAGGHQISTEQVPPAWLQMTAFHVAGIPVILVAAALALALLSAVLQRLPQGRELFAVGSNPAGARLIGIGSDRLVLGAFACAGLLAGLDGALWASRYATVDARVASGYELTVIAAVVVGGTAIRGGAGTIPGIVLGALMLLVIQNGLTLVRVNPLWLQGVYGLVIVLAISIDAFVSRRALRSTTARTAR